MTQLRNQTAIRPAQPQPRPNADRVSHEAMRLQGAMRDLRAQAQTDKKKGGFGQVMKFALLPDLKSAFGGIGQAWYLLVNTVAQLFVLAKLIDAHHPAARYQANYRFKLTEVISLAAKRVKFDRQNLPQAIMFIAIVAFLLAIALSALISVLGLVIGHAHAATPAASADPNFIANDLLGGLFNLGNGDGLIQKALGGLLSFYSTTALVFGGIILIYIVISTVAETANSGVPFGKNFNHVWAPIRFIIALGLLIPLSGGLNSGQHIVLYLAKFSSDIATTGWSQFSHAMNLNGSLSGINVDKIVARSAEETANKIFSMELCASRGNEEYANYGLGNGIYIVPQATSGNAVTISPILPAKNSNKITSTTISYIAKDGKSCGDVTFKHYESVNPFAAVTGASDMTPEDYLMRTSARAFFAFRDQIKPIVLKYRTVVDSKAIGKLSDLPSDDYNSVIDTYTQMGKDVARYASELLKNQIETGFDANMAKSGWLGAPLWLYRVAQLNASLQSMILGWQPSFSNNISTAEAELVANARTMKNAPIELTHQSKNMVPDFLNETGTELQASASEDYHLGAAGAIGSYTLGTAMRAGSQAQQVGRNLIEIAVNKVADKLGCSTTSDCLQYLKAVDGDNPITTIATVGQTFFSFGTELFLNAAAATAAQGVPLVGNIAASITPIFFTLGMAFLGTGILMGFLIPLAPALRFYAAVVGWVMTVLQLILGIPVVALGHLSTKGDGYMGDMRGFYAALLGLALRPLLIVFGLIVGFIAFTIGVKIINAVFIPVVESTFNLNSGGVVLFHMAVFAFIYAFFLFALANSAFKMIDMVPDQAISWINARLEKQGTEDDFRQVGEQAKGGFVSVASGTRELSGHVGGAIRPVGQGITQVIGQ